MATKITLARQAAVAGLLLVLLLAAVPGTARTGSLAWVGVGGGSDYLGIDDPEAEPVIDLGFSLCAHAGWLHPLGSMRAGPGLLALGAYHASSDDVNARFAKVGDTRLGAYRYGLLAVDLNLDFLARNTAAIYAGPSLGVIDGSYVVRTRVSSRDWTSRTQVFGGRALGAVAGVSAGFSDDFPHLGLGAQIRGYVVDDKNQALDYMALFLVTMGFSLGW